MVRRVAREVALSGTVAVVAKPKTELSPLELLRIITIEETARLRSTSIDSVIREDRRRVARGLPSQFVRVSERRVGLRLKDALRLD
jgi:hypothetical protein